MDRTVNVSRSFLNEVRGFLWQFASACSNCFRRSPYNCGECHTVRRAKALVSAIDSMRCSEEEKYFVEHPRVEKMARIEAAMRTAGRPVRSDELVITGISRQYKRKLLKRMVNDGSVREEKVDGNYFYSLAERHGDKNTKQTTTRNT